MKTLDKEVQIAIINEAGSTFRNYVLAATKDSGTTSDKAATAAAQVTQKFIELCTLNLENQVKLVDGCITIRGFSLNTNTGDLLVSGQITLPSKLSTTVYIYQWSKSVPKLPQDSLYNWKTGTLNLAVSSNGWSGTVPPNAGNAGETLYVSSMVLNNSHGNESTIVGWQGSKVESLTYNGTNGI